MDENFIELIEKAIKGDKNALNELYNLSYQKIYFYCLKIMKNSEEAKDLTQETFIQIFNSIQNLKEPKAFKSWAYRIAFNLACKKWDKEKKDFALVNADADDYLESVPEFKEESLPEDKVQLQATKDIIKGFIDKLPEVQRTVVLLFYYEKMSTAEIAEAMNCSENTVKSRLNYARTKIRLEVEAEEKRGVKLYAITLPILLLSLEEMAQENVLSLEDSQRILENIKATLEEIENPDNNSQKEAETLPKKSILATKILASKKALIAIIALLIGGGCISAYIIAKHKTEESLSQEEAKLKNNGQENSLENIAESTSEKAEAKEEEKAEEYVDYNKVYKDFFANRVENIDKIFPNVGIEGEETVKGTVLDYNNDGKAEFIVCSSYVSNDTIMRNNNSFYYLKYENGSVVRDVDAYMVDGVDIGDVLYNCYDGVGIETYTNYYMDSDGVVYEFYRNDETNWDDEVLKTRERIIDFNRLSVKKGKEKTVYPVKTKTDFIGENGQSYSKFILKDGSERVLRKIEIESENAYEISFADEFNKK